MELMDRGPRDTRARGHDVARLRLRAGKDPAAAVDAQDQVDGPSKSMTYHGPGSSIYWPWAVRPVLLIGSERFLQDVGHKNKTSKKRERSRCTKIQWMGPLLYDAFQSGKVVLEQQRAH